MKIKNLKVGNFIKQTDKWYGKTESAYLKIINLTPDYTANNPNGDRKPWKDIYRVKCLYDTGKRSDVLVGKIQNWWVDTETGIYKPHSKHTRTWKRVTKDKVLVDLL